MMDKFKKFIMVFGLEYSVLWSVVIYFLWDDGPIIFTVLDAIAGLVIIHIGYKILKDKEVLEGHGFMYSGLILASLVYNSAWTLVIMLFLEIDLAGFGLPLDLISLYATGTLAYEVWHSIKTRYHAPV